jgi:ribosomal protein L40E
MTVGIPDAAERMIVGVGLFIPVTAWVVWTVRRMIDAEISSASGLLCIGAAILLLGAGMWGGYVVGAVVGVVMLASLAAVPYLFSKIDDRISREADQHLLEQAFRAYGDNPQNVAAHFRIAALLYTYGWRGHAIAIAERAASSLSTEVDPVANRSIRDLFRQELYRLEQWKEEATDRDFRPIQCLRCHASNPAGTIACVQCQAPVLLDHARTLTLARPFYSRLFLAWSAIAAAIGGGAIAGLTLEGNARYVVIFVLVLLAGAFLAFVFRDKRPLSAR